MAPVINGDHSQNLAEVGGKEFRALYEEVNKAAATEGANWDTQLTAVTLDYYAMRTRLPQNLEDRANLEFGANYGMSRMLTNLYACDEFISTFSAYVAFLESHPGAGSLRNREVENSLLNDARMLQVMMPYWGRAIQIYYTERMATEGRATPQQREAARSALQQARDRIRLEVQVSYLESNGRASDAQVIQLRSILNQANSTVTNVHLQQALKLLPANAPQEIRNGLVPNTDVDTFPPNVRNLTMEHLQRSLVPIEGNLQQLVFTQSEPIEQPRHSPALIERMLATARPQDAEAIRNGLAGIGLSEPAMKNMRARRVHAAYINLLAGYRLQEADRIVARTPPGQPVAGRDVETAFRTHRQVGDLILNEHVFGLQTTTNHLFAGTLGVGRALRPSPTDRLPNLTNANVAGPLSAWVQHLREISSDPGINQNLEKQRKDSAEAVRGYVIYMRQEGLVLRQTLQVLDEAYLSTFMQRLTQAIDAANRYFEGETARGANIVMWGALAYQFPQLRDMPFDTSPITRRETLMKLRAEAEVQLKQAQSLRNTINQTQKRLADIQARMEPHLKAIEAIQNEDLRNPATVERAEKTVKAIAALDEELAKTITDAWNAIEFNMQHHAETVFTIDSAQEAYWNTLRNIGAMAGIILAHVVHTRYIMGFRGFAGLAHTTASIVSGPVLPTAELMYKAARRMTGGAAAAPEAPPVNTPNPNATRILTPAEQLARTELLRRVETLTQGFRQNQIFIEQVEACLTPQGKAAMRLRYPNTPALQQANPILHEVLYGNRSAAQALENLVQARRGLQTNLLSILNGAEGTIGVEARGLIAQALLGRPLSNGALGEAGMAGLINAIRPTGPLTRESALRILDQAARAGIGEREVIQLMHAAGEDGFAAFCRTCGVTDTNTIRQLASLDGADLERLVNSLPQPQRAAMRLGQGTGRTALQTARIARIQDKRAILDAAVSRGIWGRSAGPSGTASEFVRREMRLLFTSGVTGEIMPAASVRASGRFGLSRLPSGLRGAAGIGMRSLGTGLAVLGVAAESMNIMEEMETQETLKQARSQLETDIESAFPLSRYTRNGNIYTYIDNPDIRVDVTRLRAINDDLLLHSVNNARISGASILSMLVAPAAFAASTGAGVALVVITLPLVIANDVRQGARRNALRRFFRETPREIIALSDPSTLTGMPIDQLMGDLGNQYMDTWFDPSNPAEARDAMQVMAYSLFLREILRISPVDERYLSRSEPLADRLWRERATLLANARIGGGGYSEAESRSRIQSAAIDMVRRLMFMEYQSLRSMIQTQNGDRLSDSEYVEAMRRMNVLGVQDAGGGRTISEVSDSAYRTADELQRDRQLPRASADAEAARLRNPSSLSSADHSFWQSEALRPPYSNPERLSASIESLLASYGATPVVTRLDGQGHRVSVSADQATAVGGTPAYQLERDGVRVYFAMVGGRPHWSSYGSPAWTPIERGRYADARPGSMQALANTLADSIVRMSTVIESRENNADAVEKAGREILNAATESGTDQRVFTLTLGDRTRQFACIGGIWLSRLTDNQPWTALAVGPEESANEWLMNRYIQFLAALNTHAISTDWREFSRSRADLLAAGATLERRSDGLIFVLAGGAEFRHAGGARNLWQWRRGTGEWQNVRSMVDTLAQNRDIARTEDRQGETVRSPERVEQLRKSGDELIRQIVADARLGANASISVENGVLRITWYEAYVTEYSVQNGVWNWRIPRLLQRGVAQRYPIPGSETWVLPVGRNMPAGAPGGSQEVISGVHNSILRTLNELNRGDL